MTDLSTGTAMRGIAPALPDFTAGTATPLTVLVNGRTIDMTPIRVAGGWEWVLREHGQHLGSIRRTPIGIMWRVTLGYTPGPRVSRPGDAVRLILTATDSDPDMDEALRRVRTTPARAQSDVCPMCERWTCTCTPWPETSQRTAALTGGAR